MSKRRSREPYWARYVPSWRQPEPIKPIIHEYEPKDPCEDCTWPLDMCRRCPFL